MPFLLGLPWGTRLASRCLMNVSCRSGWGLVVAAEVVKDDLVADSVLMHVDTKLKMSGSASETTSGVVLIVHNLFWPSDDAIS